MEPIWKLQSGEGPLVAAAIHDGHAMREDLQPQLALSSAQRLREEDPYTGEWTEVAANRVVGKYSRFQVDLNRPRPQAIYLTPADAWGLRVWLDQLPPAAVERSLAEYDGFYATLHQLYSQLAERYGNFVVYDLHTYNHRRAGPDGPAADPVANPQVNVGTGTMPDRSRFAGVVERFIRDLTAFDFPAGPLDVRENVKFFGGNHPRWTHEQFPRNACVLAIEFKKFFMDEWTGEANRLLLDAIPRALAATVPGVLEELRRIPP